MPLIAMENQFRSSLSHLCVDFQTISPMRTAFTGRLGHCQDDSRVPSGTGSLSSRLEWRTWNAIKLDSFTNGWSWGSSRQGVVCRDLVEHGAAQATTDLSQEHGRVGVGIGIGR